MNKKLHKSFYLLTIIAVLSMSFMPSYTVFADGGTEGDPPPEDPPVTEPADLPAEEPAEVPPAEPAEEPTGEDTPAEEPATVPEIMEQVPEGTDLVVVNQEGEAEPLASEAAAEILVEGDPVWCPEGQAPTPGNNGCTASYLGFDDLIGDLAGGTYAGEGVIWVASTYDNTEDTSQIVFNGNNGNLGNLTDISVIGGWDGVNGSTSVDPNNPSVLDDRLRFRNWTGNVSVSNLVIQDATGGSSLQINTDGDISVDNITVDGSVDGPGAALNNCRESGGACTVIGDVTVTNSEFNNTLDGNGVTIRSGGDTTIENVDFDGNENDGVNINTYNEPDANVLIIDSTVSNNDGDGIQTNQVGGTLTIKNSTVNDNGSEGIITSDTQGDLKISGVTATGNNLENIEIDLSRGNVTLVDVTASDSTNREGVDIHDTDGNLYVKSTTAENNAQEGIEIVNVDGSLTINCSQFTNNGQDGIYVEVDHDFVVRCSQSTDNGAHGIEISPVAPSAQLLSFETSGNGGDDINYDPALTTVTEKEVDCSGKAKKDSEPSGEKGPWTKLYCLPGEIKVALYDTYGDKVEFDNLCGYDAGVFDPNTWNLPEEIPGGGEDYILSLQEKMLAEIPGLEPVTDYGLPGIIAQVLDELPFMLPDGFSYASAFFTAVVDEAETLVDPLPEEAGLTVRFRVPMWLDPGDELTILWWNGADWVDLGGEYSEDGYYFQITTEETGVFVLATVEALD